MARLVERLEAHLDGLRIAGNVGREIAQERYEEFPEAGELFALRMLTPAAENMSVNSLDIESVRRYLKASLDKLVM